MERPVVGLSGLAVGTAAGSSAAAAVAWCRLELLPRRGREFESLGCQLVWSAFALRASAGQRKRGGPAGPPLFVGRGGEIRTPATGATSSRRCAGTSPLRSDVQAAVLKGGSAPPFGIAALRSAIPTPTRSGVRILGCQRSPDTTRAVRKPNGSLWSGWGDSNSRPLDPQSSALTRLRYTPR